MSSDIWKNLPMSDKAKRKPQPDPNLTETTTLQKAVREVIDDTWATEFATLNDKIDALIMGIDAIGTMMKREHELDDDYKDLMDLMKRAIKKELKE